jgi:hypothetical protein
MTNTDPKPRRHGWLTFASLLFALLSLLTPLNVLFGVLAIVTAATSLVCHFRYAAWIVRNAPKEK